MNEEPLYTLIENGTKVGVGDTLSGEDLLATREARHVPVSDLMYDDSLYLPDLVMDRTDARLARVLPVGHAEALPKYPWIYESPGGWKVVDFPAATELLGPQADLMVAAITKAEEFLHGEYDEFASDAPDTRYYTVSNAQWDGLVWLPMNASDAAIAALERARVDGAWWDNAFACTYGPEMLALAARDLIGTTPEWNAAAYDQLTEPWRNAFGVIHPDDKPIAVVNA